MYFVGGDGLKGENQEMESSVDDDKKAIVPPSLASVSVELKANLVTEVNRKRKLPSIISGSLRSPIPKSRSWLLCSANDDDADEFVSTPTTTRFGGGGGAHQHWHRDMKHRSVTWLASSNSLMLPGHLMCELANSVFMPVVSAVVDTLAEMPNCSKVIMTGGASASPHLQYLLRALVEKIQQRCDRTLTLLFPQNSPVAVLAGSLWYLISGEQLVSGQISDWVGIDTTVDYDEAKHTPDRKISLADRGIKTDKVRDTWWTMIEGGKAHAPIFNRTNTCMPDSDSGSDVVISVYSFPHKDTTGKVLSPPYWVKDAKYLTQLAVPVQAWSRRNWKSDRSINLEFKYGGAELTICATYVDTGVKRQLRLNWGSRFGAPAIKKPVITTPDTKKEDVAVTVGVIAPSVESSELLIMSNTVPGEALIKPEAVAV